MKFEVIAFYNEASGVLFPVERMLDKALLSAMEEPFPKQCAHVLFLYCEYRMAGIFARVQAATRLFPLASETR